jgi:hypothetical protein
VDDERIRRLTEEVLSQLGTPSDPVAADLETRVARLEGAVQALSPGRSASAALPRRADVHPSLQLLDVPSGGDHCVLEPDKPCVRSGRCRTFGH